VLLYTNYYKALLGPQTSDIQLSLVLITWHHARTWLQRVTWLVASDCATLNKSQNADRNSSVVNPSHLNQTSLKHSKEELWWWGLQYSWCWAGYVWFWYLFLCWGAAVLSSKHSARREDSFLHQVGHEAGYLLTGVVSFTILLLWLHSMPAPVSSTGETGSGMLSMLLLHSTQCFLKILGWGSSWYDAIFYTYLSWWGKLGS